VPHVDFHVHPQDRDRRARTRGQAQIVRPPVAEAFVPGQARRPYLHAHWPAPIALHGLDDAAHLLGRAAKGVIGGPRAAGIGAVENECRGAFGISRCEEQGHRSAFGDAEERRALGASRVHDGPYVVHALLEGWEVAYAVRQSGAALVEANEPGEGAEALQEAS
jgi:hypothetical protein